MRRAVHFKLIIILLLICPIYAHATECGDHCVGQPHVNICLCTRCFNRSLMLFYKGRVAALNEYISKLKFDGRLSDKKFEITSAEGFITYPHTEVSQNKRACFIETIGHPDLKYLAHIVSYFAEPDWHSFVLSEESFDKWAHSSGELNYKDIFDRRILQKVKDPILTAFLVNPVKLMSIGDLDVIYQDDTLKYLLNGKLLEIDECVGSPFLPIKVKDRYIIGTCEYNYVISDEAGIIKKAAIDYYEWECEGEVKVYDEWVNFFNEGNGMPHSSYSYKTNKFYIYEYDWENKKIYAIDEKGNKYHVLKKNLDKGPDFWDSYLEEYQ